MGRDFDEIRAKAKPARAEARVLLDQDLLVRHAEAEAELAELLGSSELNPPGVRELAAKVQAVEAEIAEAEEVFVFEAIGQQAWMALVAEHPPTKAQADAGSDVNPDTFQPVAVAASCVDPQMSEEDVGWLWAHLNLAEWQKLWAACLEANLGRSDRPKSLTASAVLRLNGRSSTIAPPGESLAASS